MPVMNWQIQKTMRSGDNARIIPNTSMKKWQEKSTFLRPYRSANGVKRKNPMTTPMLKIVWVISTYESLSQTRSHCEQGEKI